MGFLAPYMIWGSLAAGIPIALHFFFRSRYRTVPWAAMKFLLTSVEQTSRRLKFQELLLLLLRVTVLVLLALALARPLTVTSSGAGGSGTGEAVDAVFVFDTSFSMAAKDGDSTRLERARAAALDIIDKLPSNSTVQIVTCSDRADLLGPRSPTRLEQARELIDKLTPTGLATDFAPGIAKAHAVLKLGQMSNKELYFFSDMQKFGWEQQSETVNKTLQEVGKIATVYMIRCGRKTPRNVSIVSITPQSKSPRPGERVSFAVFLRNTGVEPVRDLSVSLFVDGEETLAETQPLKELKVGETRSVVLSAELKTAGHRVITAKVKADDLDVDNRLDQVIQLRNVLRILVVDGAPNISEPREAAAYDLVHALVPVSDAALADYHILPIVVSPRQADRARLSQADLCILTNVALQPIAPKKGDKQPVEVLSAEFLDGLGEFVREGKGLMIFAGDNVVPEAYNKVLGEQRKLLPYKLTKVEERPYSKKWKIDRSSVELPAFLHFRDDEHYNAFNSMEAYKLLQVEMPKLEAKTKTAKDKDKEKEKATEAASAKYDTGREPDTAKEALKAKQEAKMKESIRVGLRFNDGQPFVLTHRVDAGEVMLFTIASYEGHREFKDLKDDEKEEGKFLGLLDWTNMPTHPLFLPLVHLSVGHLLHQQTQTHNGIVGQEIPFVAAPDQKNRSFILLEPDGNRQRIGLPDLVAGRPVVTLGNLLRPGVYRLTSVDHVAGSTDDLYSPQLEKALKEGKASVGLPFAVAPDLRESADLESLSEPQIDQRLGFRVIHVQAGADPSAYLGLDRTKREWTMWLLVAVLVCALAEGVMAWFCGRAW